MLTHPTHNRLVALGLNGMAKALDEQQRQPDIATLAFEERLALLVDREATERENKRLIARLRFASLRQNAVVEDIDMKAPRGLDKPLFQKLVAGEWIDRHQNLLIIGPTGVGKSWIACALGHKACRDNRSVLYQRLPRLFDADWGLAPMTAEQQRDLLEMMEDRHVRRLTTSPPTDLMTTSSREPASVGGRDHRNPWPASIGTGGRLRSESTADFVGMRSPRMDLAQTHPWCGPGH
ncbi:ATP-binding protein [Bradyrhizobium sp. STM 3566]|uniref:ATP-binding protein n=1 Tax=Bradyrhizobium sp. STM 3566 TaxID=578928 RepID=UPI00388E4B16